MSAYWSRRDTTTLSSQSGFTGNILFTNPYFRPIGVSPVQGVALSFADVFGKSATSKARFDSYGVTPSISIGLGGNWQLRAMANFGESYNLVREQTINSTAATLALAGTTTATALNPIICRRPTRRCWRRSPTSRISVTRPRRWPKGG